MTTALAIGHSRQHINTLQAVARAAQNDARLRGGNWRAHQATLHGVDVVCFRIASGASVSVLTVCPDGAVTPRSETEAQALIAKGAEVDFSAPITPKPWQANRDLFADPEPAPAAPRRGPANLDALLTHVINTRDTAIRDAITANSLGGEDIAHAVLRLHNYATSAESRNRPNNALIRRARQELASYLRGEMPVIGHFIAAEQRGEWDPLRTVLGYPAVGQTAPGQRAASPPGDLISNDETASEKTEIPPEKVSEFSPERCLRDRGLTLTTLSTEDLPALLDNLAAPARYDFAEWLLPRRHDLRPVVDEVLTDLSPFDRKIEPRADFYHRRLVKRADRDAAEAQFQRDGIVGFEVGEHPLACIHPSAKQPGHFQVTTYDHLGAIGDQQYATLQDAVREVVLVSKGRALPVATTETRLAILADAGIVTAERAAVRYDALPADLTTLTALARHEADRRLADGHTAIDSAFHTACHVIAHRSGVEDANPVRDALRGATRAQARGWLCDMVEKLGLAPPLVYFEAIKETAVQALVPTAPKENPSQPRTDKTTRRRRLQAFGEKIGGSRKEQAQYEKRLEQPLPEDLKQITLGKHFPMPDYEQLVEAGHTPLTVALVKVCRDEIPAKPRREHSLRRWRDQLDTLRQLAANLLDDPTYAQHFTEKMQKHPTLTNLLAQAELLLALGFPRVKSLNGYRIEQMDGITSFRGQNFPPPGVTRHAVKQNHVLRNIHTTWEEAVTDVKQRLQQTGAATRQPKLDIWQLRGGEIVIGKKVAAGKYLDLQGGFTSAQAAREYMATHRETLLARLAERKQKPTYRRIENRERQGPDYRDGEDVTGDRMMATFGFRGGDYGQYVGAENQQWHLNQSHDALMDLARVLGIDSQAIGLNRALGIGYGARGRGKANATYFPKHRVINLTKLNGPGRLAHEWFHALDHLLAEQSGLGDQFLTEYCRHPARAKAFRGRPETLAAFQDLVNTLLNSSFAARCESLDTARSKDYYSLPEEMAARCFEHYVHTALKAAGQHSDYLVNLVDDSDLDPRLPLPHPDEAQAIHRCFDRLIATLQCRTLDKGVTLFRLADRLSAPVGNDSELRRAMERRLAQFRHDTGIPVVAVADIKDLPATLHHKVLEAEDDASAVRGALHNGRVYVVYNAHRDDGDLAQTLLHDGLTHFGLRRVFGKERVGTLMDEIYIGLDRRQRGDLATLAGGAHLNLADRDQRRQATEEYVAHVAERGLEQNLWQRVVGRVKGWLREIPWLAGLADRYSDNDITSLLGRVHRQLRATSPQPGNEAAVLSKVLHLDIAHRRAAWAHTGPGRLAATDREHPAMRWVAG